MGALLFLLGIVAVVVIWSAARATSKINRFVAKRLGHTPFISKTIGLLIVTAQVSELVRAIEHTSIVSITAALLLLAIVVATRSGTEGKAD
jgi:hypothetical protein